MASKQILVVIALVAVCLWSAVMAALGELTAVVTLVPSLGLLVQQIAAALSGSELRPLPGRRPTGTDGVPPAGDPSAGGEGTPVAGEEHTR
jgi:hypothetical protein